jgi:hypothetical protein
MVKAARFRHAHALVTIAWIAVADWFQINEDLRRIAARQILFVGGAPRSGTTWLQQIIDQHPQASCRGEALFAKELFPYCEDVITKRRAALEAKNATVFGHTTGYPLPGEQDSGILAATAMLLAFRQQAEGRDCLAYGEKTPENVFSFPAFKRLFPDAKLIAIARDPRDLLISAWHFFQRKTENQADDEAKLAFIRSALPSLDRGMKAMLQHRRTDPASCLIVTYEQLHRDPMPSIAGIFHFLGLEATDAIVTACLDATRFETMTEGRKAGEGVDGSFLRKGVVGDWRSTLTPAMSDVILAELGWAFPHFGWVG